MEMENMEPLHLLCFLTAASRQLTLYQTLKVQTHFQRSYDKDNT